MPVLYQGGAGGSGGAQVGISTGGNTSGDTGLASSQLVLVGSNLTMSGSTNGGSMTITVSAPTTAAQLSAGISGGNTSGDTGLVNSRIVFAGGNNVTLSGSTNGGSATVTISAGGGGGASGSFFANMPMDARVARGTAQGSVFLQPLNPWGGMPFAITAGHLQFLMSGNMSESTASTAAKTHFIDVGFYTISASSTLNLVFSASTSFGSNAANNSMSSILHGLRFVNIASSIWSNSASAAATPAFSAGQEYVMGRIIRSSGETFGLSWIGASVQGAAGANMSGTMGVGLATGNASMHKYPFEGSFSATSAALPTTIHRSDIVGSGGFAEPHVIVYLNNRISSF